jgi:hypothetical protein
MGQTVNVVTVMLRVMLANFAGFLIDVFQPRRGVKTGGD